MKANNLSRCISLIMTVCLLLTTISCSSSKTDSGEKNETAETTAALTEEVEIKELSDAEKRALVPDGVETVDYNGREFNILSRQNFVYQFDAEADGDTINDAVYKRNMAVEERFKIDIITHGIGEGTAANILSQAEKSIRTDDDAYQLLAAFTYHGATQSVNGHYLNWYEIPHVNLEQPWWSDGFVEAASVNGTSYIATGDLSLLFSEVTLCMLFNKKLAENYKLGDIYDTIKSGDWTLELLAEYASRATEDLDGDGDMDTDDRWGLGINNNTHIDCFLYAFEAPLTERDSDGIPQLVMNSDKMVSVFEKVYAFLIDSGDAFVFAHATDAFDKGMFESDKGLFMTTWLGNCSTLRDMETDFGIIPYPKWDKNQENYSTYYLDRTDSFLIPTTADVDFVGRITEVMACESYKKVIPAFYDTALDNKYTRDEESKEMIDIILQNIRFDFANIYAFGVNAPGQLLRSSIGNKNSNFSSQYAANEKKYKKSIEVFIKKFTD